MSNEHVAPFHGDKDDENPEDFIRSFFRRMGNSTNEVKTQQFPNFLQADSVADEWFKDLESAQKMDWANIEKAFRIRWPRKKAAKKTTEEYEEEITNLKLKIDDLGKKEKIAGRNIYTHIAWADKMEMIIRGAKLETTTTYISPVRKELPNLVREKVGAGHNDWTAFLKAIRDLNIDYIRDGVDIWQKEKTNQAKLDKRIKKLETLTTSPIAALSQRFSNFNLGTPTPANQVPNPAIGSTTQNATSPQVAQFRSQTPNFTQRPPATQAEKDAIRIALLKYPQHPDTDAGRRAHQAQQADWATTHGSARVSATTPYPLRPGTAPANSNECFTCGGTGHIGRKDGSGCGGRRPLHAHEQTWRVIVAKVLQEPRNVANIRLVTVDDYGTPWEDIQGNGEGPPV